MPDVYVAAGGNVEPLRYLQRALELLELEFGPLTVSPAYRNPAVGFSGEDFINLVVRFGATADVASVREKLQWIEARCERLRAAPKWGPRTMDLDILLYGEMVCDQPGLVLPRPDLARRAYMLKPMADIAPDLVHPRLGRTMRELWDGFAPRDRMETVTIPRCGRRQPPRSGQ
ncbi:MAG TPA: 2-amino-4-hydroxy-6-hydroxymethyldihydropteridine diphosphokinase [Steroidobacter sp.]|jgi:2-amino-4-hydroxy-6-hydroxymethyldihydropteridine diphosphokinase|nr:2-amino-4-hydroxy-6-hydroxymethyldihydropteridine diphosphokinase [Steroidobacter sp.]